MQLANYHPPLPAQEIVHKIQHPQFPLTSRQKIIIYTLAYMILSSPSFTLFLHSLFFRQGVVLTDLHESETEYTIICDLPGVLENDLSIEHTGKCFYFFSLLFTIKSLTRRKQ